MLSPQTKREIDRWNRQMDDALNRFAAAVKSGQVTQDKGTPIQTLVDGYLALKSAVVKYDIGFCEVMPLLINQANAVFDAIASVVPPVDLINQTNDAYQNAFFNIPPQERD